MDSLCCDLSGTTFPVDKEKRGRGKDKDENFTLEVNLDFGSKSRVKTAL
jgi:hypothetical protein